MLVMLIELRHALVSYQDYRITSRVASARTDVSLYAAPSPRARAREVEGG